MDNLNNQKMMSANSVFGKRFLNSKSLYLYCFNALPSIHFVGSINGEKAYKAFKATFASLFQSEHQIRCFDKKRKRYDFDETIIILNNDCMVEFNDGYCELLHDGKNEVLVKEFTALMSRFKVRERRKPLEINLIVSGSYGFDLRSMEVKRTKLNLDLFYEDEFKAVDEVIQQRLRKKEDKGIVLLHGLPGTGKTTYLRYLIGRIKKRVLFLSPNIAHNLMNPEFIELLVDNPNTVVVIEDAENIIRDRRTSGSSSVSNLLNISDGLLADFLNVQLICTFNSPLTMVDSALMRKGRLIAKYEFGKLSVAKAQALSNHFGFDTTVTRPMTIAEVANQHEAEQVIHRVEITGFHKRDIIEN
jgi:hypothetical protein